MRPWRRPPWLVGRNGCGTPPTIADGHAPSPSWKDSGVQV
ncbi:hypothetical protein HMPREF0762_00929 [Slackia exigua ATCC 700122]|uniref:Uncharacterized protein n=1 Tax=Slackia exigua (strain ATCC 700122 / DSM 15923 / CIP 105133 / JCM 11022 / KCTC 5966 / S-7) TaxID=649764 RepID=D0WGH4_SLAES|nr:hypothetical protein HMPREF0762_00929 [Slackia exigua ATCC 700122]